jgi:hypothetical protein
VRVAAPSVLTEVECLHHPWNLHPSPSRLMQGSGVKRTSTADFSCHSVFHVRAARAKIGNLVERLRVASFSSRSPPSPGTPSPSPLRWERATATDNPTMRIAAKTPIIKR